MTLYTGRRNALGIGVESTYGATTTIDFYIPFLSCDIGEMHSPISDKAAIAVRDVEGPNSVQGKKWGEGSIEVVLDAKTAPYWFGLALGNITSSLSSGIYYHFIRQRSQNEPLSATIWKDRGVDKVQFPGCAVDTLSIDFADDVAKVKVKVLSKIGIAGESLTPNYSVGELQTFRNAYLLVGSGAISTLKISEFSLNINNNLEPIYAPNSNDVDRIASKNFEVKGSFTVLFEGSTQKLAFTGLTKQTLQLVFTSVSDSGIIQIDIPKFRDDDWKIDAPIDDLSKEKISFVGEYNASNTQTISLQIRNSVSGY